MNRRLILLPLLAVTVALLLWWQRSQESPPGVPACTWRIGDRGTATVQFEKVAAESPVRLATWCDVPRHWYVVSWSQEDGTIALFPSPQLTTSAQNPLGPGRVLLPGNHAERTLSWPMRGGIAGVTWYLAIASQEPLPDLAAFLATLRQATNQTFPDASMAVANPKDRAPAHGPGTPLMHSLLQAARDLKTETPNGPMTPMPGRGDVWLANWRVLWAAGG